MEVFTKDECYSDNFPVTSKMKYDFKYVEYIDQEVLEKSKSKWIKEGRREGKKEGIINTLLMLVKDGIISVEDAAKRANLSVGTLKNI